MAACSGNAQETFDLVILNGRVVDPETGFDAVRNVGIRNGRIVAITEDEIAGRNSVDASGLVVAPGFIDTHTHSSDKYVIRMAMMDGVTTSMDYELGPLPGQPIRYPVESTGPHEPTKTAQWLEEFTIDDGSLLPRVQ